MASSTSPATEHAVDQEALPICTECEESFSTHRALAAHLKKHAKPVLCPFCEKPVKYLGPHLRKEHPDEDEYSPLIRSLTELVNENRALKKRIRELEEQLTT